MSELPLQPPTPIAASQVNLPRRAWGMLFARPVMFLAMQLVVAAAVASAGSATPLADSARWWLWYVTVGNVLCLWLMARFTRSEGSSLKALYGFNRATWKGDLLWLLLGVVVSAPAAQLPNVLLAKALFGDPAIPGAMLFQPLPLAAVYPLLVLMPLTHAFAELPTYWGYAAPRLRRLGMGRWTTILVVGGVLSLQHVALGLLPDWRFNVWHAFMFLPFAVWVGWLIDRRPTLLPYLMAVHALLDLSLPLITLQASMGHGFGG